jgi:hypothetical protein
MDGAILSHRLGSAAVSDDNDKTPRARFSGLIHLPPAPDMVDFEWCDFMPPSASDNGKCPEANVESPHDAAMLQGSGGDNGTQASPAAIQLELTQKPSDAQEGFEMMARTASLEAMQAVLGAKAQKLDEKEAELRALEESLDARQARINLDISELQDRLIDCMKREDEVLKRCHEAKGWQKRIFDWQEDVARRSNQVFQRELVADQRDAIAAANMHAGISALGVSG